MGTWFNAASKNKANFIVVVRCGNVFWEYGEWRKEEKEKVLRREKRRKTRRDGCSGRQSRMAARCVISTIKVKKRGQ